MLPTKFEVSNHNIHSFMCLLVFWYLKFSYVKCNKNPTVVWFETSNLVGDTICCTLQYSIVQYTTAYCSIVQYSIVQYNIVQCSTVQYNIVQYSAVQYSIVEYTTV